MEMTISKIGMSMGKDKINLFISILPLFKINKKYIISNIILGEAT